MTSKFTAFLTTAVLGLIASPAFAFNGAVKVDCGSNEEGNACFGVSLAQVCDAYYEDSRPVAISCDNTATPGSGVRLRCGKGHCVAFGTLIRSDRVGDYCEAGNGNDAIVTCQVDDDNFLARTEEGEEVSEPGADQKQSEEPGSDQKDESNSSGDGK